MAPPGVRRFPLRLSPEEAAREVFGVPYLFPYQRLVIANMLEAARAPPESDGAERGRQIVVLPTGAGKSLCFQLPAVLLPFPTLVVYPLLSLMADQERRLRERGLEPALLRGEQSRAEREALWGRVRAGDCRLVIANPEVLLTEAALGALRTVRLSHLVIDEAHCVSEWGESFRPAYLRLREIAAAIAEGNARAGTGPPLVTAFTATASAQVIEKIDEYIFDGRGASRVMGNPDRANITYAARGAVLKDLAVRDLLAGWAGPAGGRGGAERPAIVFCSSRVAAVRLAGRLRRELPHRIGLAGEDIRFYHAGLSREEKRAIEGWFLGSRRGVLTATCAYGMGVDKPDIRTVIHRDCPPSVEAYLQESGRAGRDGGRAEAALLWGPDDEARLSAMQTGREGMARLLEYARDTGGCRRRALLALLDYEAGDDTALPPQACCDVCGGSARRGLREEASVTGFFRRNRLRWTVPQAARLFAQADPPGCETAEAASLITCFIGRGVLACGRGPLWKGRVGVGKGDGKGTGNGERG